MPEWNHNKRWNPFNSYKLLAHAEYWKNIKRGSPVPAPILVTVDPTNKCNLDCEWCNAKYIRDKSSESLSRAALQNIANFLPVWGMSTSVKAVCIAGGGEPLMNPYVGEFIELLVKNGIEVGVVTNGLLMHQYLEPLSKCTWVGVSVDAGTKGTYKMYKGGGFDRVCQNIESLKVYSENNRTKLAMDRPAYGISFKYLLYEDNMLEVADATRIAKEIGCKNIHFRPAGTPWDKIGGGVDQIAFKANRIEMFSKGLEEALKYDGPDFGVYGVTHKFNSQFEKANHFSACHAVFMTAVFEPPTVEGDSFTLGLCCDRRGDKSVELLHNEEDPLTIRLAWGSKHHWEIHDQIKVGTCPRCTYQPHNEIYEQVIKKDSMTHKFI